MKGILTKIQNFSLHDGPGIRTTLFFKGCNMRCPWCHNPETYHKSPQLYYNEDLCLNCYTCVNVCPEQAINITTNHITINPSCSMCEMCCENCVNEAIEVVGKYMSVDEIITQVKEDYSYYIESGGGVTLSGGEVLLQKDFALEILKACKSQGIHTCIESNMSIPYELCKDVLNYCDMIIMDIKLLDNEKHMYWTGISNDNILDNFLKLSSINKPIIVRTPIISGVNDNESEIRSITNFIRSNPNLVKYELLEYHALGDFKRKHLGMPINHTFTPIPTDKMNLLRKIADLN